MKRTVSSTNPGGMGSSSNEDFVENIGDVDLNSSNNTCKDDINMSFSPSRASSSASGIMDESFDGELIDRFIQQTKMQLKSGLRWCSNINNFLPDVSLNQTINLMSDAVRNGADDEDVAVIILRTIDRVVCPILRQIIREDFNPSKEQLGLIYNCLFGCVRLCGIKLTTTEDIESVSDEYWWLLETIFECSRFYQKLKTVELQEVTRQITVDLDASLWDTVCSPSNGKYQLYEALLVWFFQLHGFASMSRLFQSLTPDTASPEKVVLYIRWIHCAAGFLQVRSLMPSLYNFLEQYVEIISSMSDKDFHCEKLTCDVYDAPPLMFLNIAYDMLVGRSQDYENDERIIVSKINGAKLRYLKTVILEAKFNIRMSGMDELYRLVRADYQKGSLIPTEFLELWIADNNLIQALYKDNLHHNAYVERLRLIMTCLLEKEVLAIDVLPIMWGAQKDKHDAIQRNVNLLTSRLSAYFTEELVNGLMTLLHGSWISGTFHDREVIIDLLHNIGLEFCRKHLEAHTVKVVQFLWEEGHSEYVVQNLPVATKIYNVLYVIIDAYRTNAGSFSVLSDIMILILKDIVSVGTDRNSSLKGIIDIVMDLLQKCVNLQAEENPLMRSHILVELDEELRKIGPRSLAEATVEVIITIMGDYKALDDESESRCSSAASGRETVCSGAEEFTNFLEKLGSLLEFLRFYISERNCVDLLAPESSSLYALWESVINARQAKIRDLGYDFFLNLMCLDDIFKDRTLLLFFNKYIVKQQLIFMTPSGFNCIEAVLKKINVLTGNLEIFTCRETDKNTYIVKGELEGIDFLKRLVEESNQEVSDSAGQFLIDLLSSPTEGKSQLDHSKDVVLKCKCWFKESVLPLIQSDSSMTSSRKIRRVLQTIILLIDLNEETNPILERKHSPLKRSLLGQGLYLHVICRSEDVQLIFGPEFGSKPVEVPNRFTAHSNMLLGDFIRQVCEKLNSQGACITPYSLSLVKKSNGSSQRFSLCDFGKTLSELELNNNDQLIAKPEKSKIGLDGTEDESYMSIVDPIRCEERENLLYGKIMSEDLEFMQTLVEIGARDDRICEFTWRLLMALPMPETDTFRALIQLKLTDDRQIFHHFIQNLANLNASQLCSHLIFLNYICLPKEFSFKTDLFDTQMLFLSCGGLQSCIDILNTRVQHCESAVLTSIIVQMTVRLLQFSLLTLTQFKKKEQIVLKGTCEFLRLSTDPAMEDPVYYMCRDYGSCTGFENIFASEVKVTSDQFSQLVNVSKCIVSETSKMDYLNIISDGQENEDIIKSVKGTALSISCLHILSYLTAFNTEKASSLLLSDVWYQLMAEIICDNRINVRSYGSYIIVKLISQYNLLFTNDAIFNTLMNRLFASMDLLNSTGYWDLVVGCINENHLATPLNNLPELLQETIEWLREAERVTQEHQTSFMDTETLVGRLKLCCALVSFLSSERKAEIGASDHGPRLLERLIYHFLLPSSRAFAQMQSDLQIQSVPRSLTTNEFYDRQGSDSSSNIPRSHSACSISYRSVAVCGNDESQRVAYDLVVTLCKDSEPCALLLKNMMLDMFYKYSTVSGIVWDVQPDYNMRKPGNYVGLKNGGATCYMNSILQQLFMIPNLRSSVLRADFTKFDLQSTNGKSTYPVKIVSSLQSVFAHLIGYDLDAFTPDELWNTLKSNGNFNLHEQQDALEFYNSVVDLIDEGMKTLNVEKACENAFGGLFADEKICKDCPHRYTCETTFTSISLDVRSHNNLLDSLKEYVKGDVLENDNAYHCEKCDKKVRAVKRMSIKKLPQTLVVQLKRFEFDWEKDVPVKYNDYFEFPLEIDMYPYTADYFEKQESGENENAEFVAPPPTDSKYKLRGVVVHSGQATNGHYYSYILSNEDGKWYKFDDTDVTPYEMNARDIKTKWFGAESGSDDGYRKRRSRNWWNAYILFYEKVPFSPTEDNVDMSAATSSSVTPGEPVIVDTKLSPQAAEPMNSLRKRSTGSPIAKLHKHFSNMSLSTRMKMIPSRLEKIVRQQNVKIKHERNQYCHNFFRFMFSLADQTSKMSNISEERSRCMRHIIEIFSKFIVFTFLPSAAELRHTLFLSQRSLWNDVWGNLFNSKECRVWFITNILFSEEISRLFLIEAIDIEVRTHYTSIVSLLLYKTYIARDTVRDLYSESTPHLISIIRSFQGQITLSIELLLLVTVNLIKLNRDRRNGNVFNTIQDLVAREFTDARIRADLWKIFVKCNFLTIAISSVGLYNGSGNDINNPANNFIFLRLCGFMFRAVNWNYFLQRERNDEMEDFEEMCPYSFHEIQLIPAESNQSLKEIGYVLVNKTMGNMAAYFEVLHNRMMYAYCLFDSSTDVLHSLLCIAWNNPLRTKASFDWVITQTKHAPEAELQKFIQFFRSILEMRDSNFATDTWLDYLLKNVDLSPVSRSGYRTNHEFGLLSIGNNGTAVQQEAQFQMLLIVLQVYEDRAVEFVRSRGLSQSLITVYSIFMTRFGGRTRVDSPINSSRSRLLSQLESVCKSLDEEPSEKNEEMKGDISIEVEDEPLDLSVPHSRASMTPQSGDKRPFPEDPSDSPTGQRRDPKLFRESAAHDIDEPELLNATSRNADEVARQTLSAGPPPVYDGPTPN